MSKLEIAAVAAQMVVQEGLEYGPAKRRAARQLGLPQRTTLPDNDELDTAVREYIAVFCAESQPKELQELRRLALYWMERLASFRPYLSGAVWRGTATRHSDIYIHLYCDDEKSAEMALIDLGVSYRTGSLAMGHKAPVNTLSLHAHCAPLNEVVGVHLLVRDHDDLRGALRADATGRAPLGDLDAVRRMVNEVE
jgi:hypothetical protein